MSSVPEYSPVAREFLGRLPDSLRQYVTDAPGVIFRVPAKAPEVGDLCVYDEGCEITVSLATGDHRHYGIYDDIDGPEPGRSQQAADQAIEWIHDILTDRARFLNQYRKGRLICGGDWVCDRDRGPLPIDELRDRFLGSTDAYREYSWSGDIVRKSLKVKKWWSRLFGGQ